jgi:hypothetical protein
LNPHSIGVLIHIFLFYLNLHLSRSSFGFQFKFFSGIQIRKIKGGLWKAVTAVGVEPFFVPLKILASFFGFAAHALVFACGFVYHID